MDSGGVERLHRFKGAREVLRGLTQMLVEAAVTFLPGFGAVALKLFREAGAHERMGVESLRLPRIGRCHQAVVSQGSGCEMPVFVREVYERLREPWDYRRGT